MIRPAAEGGKPRHFPWLSRSSCTLGRIRRVGDRISGSLARRRGFSLIPAVRQRVRSRWSSGGGTKDIRV
ncbi:hypothetical protein BHE74_00002051 [Ensete ventricosum]|uniref:Uncharacterized protein n=1 Tax=Ensete ventricosum TaxID=4639 RepID=A0A427AP21_ENSVE|nr:hypothetical protein B296_00006588 [Ensete ventricosum]RWW89044.1 hypothetical protein BHE74_00002051 [Ensete ventricosum]RZR85021.1 hypothetical protein BHM03_00011954 [Ensete ventricosum]